ncbi:Hsp70 ATPase ssc1 [Allomyces javanicus]|nr:Hsp70 ATPase ssc1 [Allomyces javanicus]
MSAARFSPYHEPGLNQLAILASFLFLLNAARIALDWLFYAGMVGEMATGAIYGTPLLALLTDDWQATFRVLGDVGLLLIVFEGGLTIHPTLLLSNLPLSLAAALTGIVTPIALSILLLHLAFGYPLLQAFAAGAALSSTSLGTAFVAFRNATETARARRASTGSGRTTPASLNPKPDAPTDGQPLVAARQPIQTRLGTVLVSASLIDDVIALVMLGIITSLGGAGTLNVKDTAFSWVVARPLVASVALAALVPVLGHYVLVPAFRKWVAPRLAAWTPTNRIYAMVMILVCVLAGLVAGANLAGASNLLGAFLAGILLCSATPVDDDEDDDDVPEPEPHPPRTEAEPVLDETFQDIFALALAPLKNAVMAPLFFASMGSAIPIGDLWKPTILWRGLVYAVLMAFAKALVGPVVVLLDVLLCRTRTSAPPSPSPSPSPPPLPAPTPDNSTSTTRSADTSTTPSTVESQATTPSTVESQATATISTTDYDTLVDVRVSAATLLGLGLIARGEIGIVIAQLAYAAGTTSSVVLLGEEPFLVAMWAIVLCTVVGPAAMAVVARRTWTKVSAPTSPWA